MPQGKGSGTRDNSTLEEKLRIRKLVLNDIRQAHFHRTHEPIILEPYGGTGAIFRKVYPDVSRGTVIEREPKKVDVLCWQRPTWAVYQGDAPALLRSGVGGHLGVNLLDVDPYGQPWDCLEGFFASLSEGLRPQSDPLWIVVHDGARQYLRRKASAIWDTPWIPSDLLAHYGNALELNYTQVAQIMLERLAAATGYDTTWIDAYQTGHVLQSTHYACRLDLNADTTSHGI